VSRAAGEQEEGGVEFIKDSYHPAQGTSGSSLGRFTTSRNPALTVRERRATDPTNR